MRRLGITLFGIALAACRPSQPALNANPLALPDVVHTTVGPIPVVLVDTLSVADTTAYVMGRFSYKVRTIYLRREITDPIQRLKTLYHELCHVEVIESGLYNHIPHDVGELLCDTFASNRVAALLRGKP